jgi:hypothetical protein
LNCDDDLLANVSSRLIPLDRLIPDTFSLEVLYMASILETITIWIFFDDDQLIIIFLHLKDTSNDFVIYEVTQHDLMVNSDAIDQDQQRSQSSSSNNITKNVLILEKLYNL